MTQRPGLFSSSIILEMRTVGFVWVHEPVNVDSCLDIATVPMLPTTGGTSSMMIVDGRTAIRGPTGVSLRPCREGECTASNKFASHLTQEGAQVCFRSSRDVIKGLELTYTGFPPVSRSSFCRTRDKA
jgi:hypothetical protein